MKFTLKDYQADAVRDVLVNLKKARKRWHEDADKHAFSLTAVTGAGKTVMAAAAFEALFHGDDEYDFDPDPGAIVIWFSDDPALNEQTRFSLMEASDRTGYTNYDGDWFIFCNIGVPGRTGHDYQNRFIGNELVWYGKTNSSVKQDSIRSMLEPDGNIYIFFREEDRAPFSFAGKATVKSHKDTVPVEITWTFALTKQLLRISNYASKVTVCQDRLACQVVQPLSKQALRSSSKGLTVIDNTRKLFLTLYIVTYCTCVYVSRRHAGHRLPNL